MSDSFIGEIRLFAGNFAPRGWATCDGQILPISQNTALFSLLGTTYGGNGTTTFGLPDLRGRLPMHWGQGPGLSPRVQGQSGGEESVTLLNNQMPIHTHPANASNQDGASTSPVNSIWAADVSSDGNTFTYSSTPNATMSPQAIGAVGGNQPHDNMSPFLTVTFIIALQGIYPSRN